MGASPILGCGSASDVEPAAWEPPPPPEPETFIHFDQIGPLTVGLREEHTLSVVVDPPEHQEVNFVLLGSPLDATLDHAAVETNDEGRASITLRTPNQSTTFRIRSWIMRGPADEVEVAAVGDGFAPVEIIPIYKGTRTITEWTASIVARATCADISPLLPLLPTGVSDMTNGHGFVGEPLIVKDAPVGPSLAVTVRAGEFAWGCSDAYDLVVGQTMKVKVNVIDKPIDVGATNLDVTFVLKPDPNAYAELLQTTSTLMADALFPKGFDPGTTLLDAIASRVPETMMATFAEARSLGAWDATVANHFALLPALSHDALRAGLLASLVDEPSEFVATLEALPSVPGSATLSPVRLGSVSAPDAGMPGMHLANLSLDVGDVMHLGGRLYWLPSRYVGAVMTQKTLQNVPEAATMADVFSKLAACDILGQTLGGFDTCDATCLAGLCHEALADRWGNAIDASAYSGSIGHINIAAAVSTSVDNTAVPTSFQGSWLGSISDGNLVAKISKAELSATTPVMPPPP
jgi:hypothetical protein